MIFDFDDIAQKVMQELQQQQDEQYQKQQNQMYQEQHKRLYDHILNGLHNITTSDHSSTTSNSI